tara:strand:- start:15 stop:767 length:753 start_codon:yes stop_codon:yes gene_type:complete
MGDIMKTKFKRFFSTDSAKAIKADKYGYMNGINYMAPHTTAGFGNMCSHSSPGCRSLCLGMYSGQASFVKDLENGTNNVRDSRKRKVEYFMTDRDSFMSEMTNAIKALARMAKNKNKKLAIRPNGSTDIRFERIKTDNGQTLPERFPNLQFIDYTKNLKRLLDPTIPSNYSLTFSLSEINRKEAKEALKNGFNVAVVFGHGLPRHYLGHRVIDGNMHDLRHLDPSPVIVGLDPRGAKAKKDKTGFVIRDY